MWGLANIAADCPKYRDAVLAKRGLEVILKVMEETKSADMLRQGVWALSNLCRGTPKPKYSQIKNAIPVLGSLVMSGMLQDSEVVTALWSIANNTEAQKTKIQELVNIKGFIPHLIQRAYSHSEADYMAPLMRTIGNISQGN